MQVNALPNDIPWTFRIATGSVFDFREARCVLLGLSRLVDRDAENIDWSLKPNLRTAFGEIKEAAEYVERDLQKYLRMALADAEEFVEDRVLEELHGKALPDGIDSAIGSRITDLRLAIGDTTRDTTLRTTLVAIRNGKHNLMDTLHKYPRVSDALHAGFLALRDTPSRNKYAQKALQRELKGSPGKRTGKLIRQRVLNQSEQRLISNAGTRWLHLVADNARIRRLSIDLFLNDPVFLDKGGRREEAEVKRFVKRLIDISEQFCGTHPSISLNDTVATGKHGGDVRASAMVELLEICLGVLGYAVGLDRCKELLLEALKPTN